jgi:hypothetical protein
MIVVACPCGARGDQIGPAAQPEECWSCRDEMLDTGIRWERAVPIGALIRPIMADIAKHVEKAK